jgi:hypothetical protein
VNERYIAPVCNGGDPIPSIPAFEHGTLAWAIGTDCGPFPGVQPMPRFSFSPTTVGPPLPALSRSWSVQIGSDAKGTPQFAGFAEYSDGKTTIFISSRVLNLPVSLTVLSIGVASELVLILWIASLLFRRRSR